MFERFSDLVDGLRGIVREFFRDNGMLGSIVAFAIVFGTAMVVLVMLILVAGYFA